MSFGTGLSAYYQLLEGDGKDGNDLTNPRNQQQRDFTTQMAISLALGVSSVITFCIIRPRWTQLYYARKKRIKQAETLPDMPKTFFGWIPVLYRVSEEEVLESVGLDAFVFLGFFKMAIKFLVIATALAAAVLTPIRIKFEGDSPFWEGVLETMPMGSYFSAAGNGTDPDNPKKEPIVTDPQYLWAYVVFVYIFTGLCLHLLFQQTKKVIKVRQAYMGRKCSISDRSVLVSGIPAEYREKEALKAYFEEKNIGKVTDVAIVKDWSRLDTLMEQREKVLRKLEEAYALWEKNAGGKGGRLLSFLPSSIRSRESSRQRDGSDQPLITRDGRSDRQWRPKMKLRLSLFGRKSVDAIDYYTVKLAKLDTIIREERKRDHEPMPVAFVTFESVATAQIATQTLVSPRPRTFVIKPAPEPEDIIWKNLYISRRERLFRTWTISICISFLTIIWLAPVGLLAGLTRISTIKKVWPDLAELIKKSPTASTLVQNFLPTLVLTLLNVAVPYVYDYITDYQTYFTKTERSNSVISKNFFFTFFNLFLVFSILGTATGMYSVIRDSLRDTTKFAYLLAESLESLSPFYTNLIVLQAFGLLPFRLLDFGSLFLYPINRFFAKTPRDYKELKQPNQFRYPFYLPQPLLIFILCLAYSVLSSGTRILFFGTIYFIISFYVFKYQLLYSMVAPYQTPSSDLWPMIFYRIVLGLALFQSSMGGFLALKKAFTRAALTVPCVAMSAASVWWYWKTYKPYEKCIALEALQTGLEEGVDRHVLETTEEGSKGAFVNPSLTSPLEGFEEFGVGDRNERGGHTV